MTTGVLVSSEATKSKWLKILLLVIILQSCSNLLILAFKLMYEIFHIFHWSNVKFRVCKSTISKLSTIQFRDFAICEINALEKLQIGIWSYNVKKINMTLMWKGSIWHLCEEDQYDTYTKERSKLSLAMETIGSFITHQPISSNQIWCSRARVLDTWNNNYQWACAYVHWSRYRS